MRCSWATSRSRINVPGISGDLLRRLGPLLDLARRLVAWRWPSSTGRSSRSEVDYGGRRRGAAAVLMAAVEGLLSGMSVEPVSLVNSLLIAEERGIRHARRTGTPEPGFETTVGVHARGGPRPGQSSRHGIGQRARVA